MERYGEIEVASFIPGFAFIKFDWYINQYIHDQILAVHHIEIEGNSIPVKRADYSSLPCIMYEHVQNSDPMTPKQVDQLLLQPDEDEASPKNIVRLLNDDCVREILVRLSLLDIYNVAKTCRRFNGIAKTVFEQKYKSKTFTLSDLKRDDEAITKERVRHFLNNFGSSVTSFSLCEKNKVISHNVVRLLDKYCKNIESLYLAGCSMKNLAIDKHIDMFGKLKKLSVCPSKIPLIRLLAACAQLEKLTIDDVIAFDMMVLKDISLPHLVALHVYSFNCCGMKQFLMRHPRIEIFSFESPSPVNSDRHHDETNDLIHKCLPNIRQVEIYCSFSYEEHQIFSGKQNLKFVNLVSCSQHPFTPIINKFSMRSTPINELQLCNGTIDYDTIESICKMKTIQKIYFYDCVGFDATKFIGLVEALPNLEEVISCSVKPDEFFDKIFPTLQNRHIKWSDETDAASSSYVSIIMH